jgi:hypothetical protein
MNLDYKGRRILIPISCVLTLQLISCLDAPRDNIYDPENPNRVSISLNVNEIGLYDLQGASVSVVREDTVAYSDTTDEHGTVVFEEVNPGIYYFLAEATYYSTVQRGPDSLWAGDEVDYKLELRTLDFEDDIPGTPSPHRFAAGTGTWAIKEDGGQSESHSVPNVYQGIDSSSEETALSLCDTEAQYFLLEMAFKVDAPSAENWLAGVVFRYQDDDNCYRLLLSHDTINCYCRISGQQTLLHTAARETNVDVWHTIRVERREGENYVRIRVDDYVLFSLYDDLLFEGQFGFIVSGGVEFSPVIVNFDDVTIDVTNRYLQ